MYDEIHVAGTHINQAYLDQFIIFSPQHINDDDEMTVQQEQELMDELETLVHAARQIA